MYWVVCQTQANREKWAAENVYRQHYEYYLPLVGTVNKQGLYVVKPLFPRYLFVKVEGPWSSLLSTFGLTGMIMAGRVPAHMPEKELEKIRQREKDGVVSLPTAYKTGDEVTVQKGVFAQHKGIVADMPDRERVNILLDVLGRKVKVLIAVDDLE